MPDSAVMVPFTTPKKLCGDHGTDGVNRFVTVQTFLHKPLQYPFSRIGIAHGDLSFDDGVKDRMHLEIRHPNLFAAMVFLHQDMPLAFLQLQPGFRFGIAQGIVFHGRATIPVVYQ